MAHIETKDPFGFVGSHVIHQRSSAASTATLRAGSFSVFGVPAETAATTAATTAIAGTGTGDSEQKEEHGWITRYDARLDSYTLFIPGKGASVHSRGDMMKLIADPSFLVQNDDDDDEFPAPIEDRTSRYVDVPMTKTVSGAAGGNNSATVRGVVKCYMPFADMYKVVYEDSTTEQVSEDAIINSMIFMLTTQKESTVTAAMEAMTVTTASDERETRRKRKRGGIIYPPPLPVPVPSSRSFSQGALTTPPATVRSVSAPVVSVTVPPPSMMPVSYSAALGMDSSPIVTPSNILELVAARAKSSSSSSVGNVSAPVPAPTIPTSAPVSKPASTPTPQVPAPATTPFIKNEPASSGNIIMLIDDEPGVDMIPFDFDADDDVVMLPVESSSSPSSSVSTEATSDSWTAPASTQPPPFYLITEEPSQMVELLETRSLAYKYVRDELLNLLDRKEASAKKIAMQYDILRNPDIKHINSIKRFTEASGLVVLNHLISTYLSEHEYKPRDADVLLLLKVVAMLPIPARKHVADSKIALTIGKLAKPRSLEMYPKLPVCITHLAKWIKRRWTEHFSKQENQQKSTQRSAASSASSSNPGQRLATRTAPPGSSGNATAGQRSSNPIDVSDRLVDTQPIPRLASRPALAGVSEAAPRPTTDVMGNPIAARSNNLSLPLSSGGTGAGRKSSLKPDWMRQQENLRRTRFTSEGSQDSTAEYNHYKRVRRTGPAGSSSSAQPLASGSTTDSFAGSSSSSSANPYSHSAENEQLESAGGARGTFGRNQKLSFGSRWSVVEFHRDAPPSSVRPSNRFYHHSQSTQRHARPRSILRRQSKYQGNLDSIR